MRAKIKEAFADGDFRLGFFTVFAINLVLIVVFYDKGWIPNDDGHYAHVANRLAKGQVLSRDIEELHPGYVHFIHAWSLKVFGTSLVSLRYPLMVLMGLQSLGVFALFFRRTGLITSVTAAIVMSSIGALEIVNPTTSLYAEACAVAAAALLVNSSPSTRHRAFKLGVLLGLVFLFRQLSAIFVVMGSLVFLFTERQDDPADAANGVVAEPDDGPRWITRAFIAFMFVGLVVYLRTSATKMAWTLFGIMPLVLLAWSIRWTTVTNRLFFPMMIRIGLGSVASAVPLVIYHIYHGSMGSWLTDTFLRSISINSVENIGSQSWWLYYIWPAIVNFIFEGPLVKLNSIYWLLLLSAALVMSTALFRRMRSVRRATPRGARFRGLPSTYAFPIIAVFYAQVTVFSEVPYYLYLGVGFTLIAGLWMWKLLPIEPRRAPLAAAVTADGELALVGADGSVIEGAEGADSSADHAARVVDDVPGDSGTVEDASAGDGGVDRRAQFRKVSTGFAWFAILMAITFHAGQPFTRSHRWTTRGYKIELVKSEVPNLGLWIPEVEDAKYKEIVDIIHARSEPGDQLMTIPNLAEVYFFSDRDNDFRIFNPTISLLNEEEVNAFMAEFDAAAPELIVHDTASQYNAGESPELLNRMIRDYDLVENVKDQFNIYQRQSG